MITLSNKKYAAGIISVQLPDVHAFSFSNEQVTYTMDF